MVDKSKNLRSEKHQDGFHEIDHRQWFAPKIDIAFDRLVPNGEPGTLVWLDPTLANTGLDHKTYAELRAVNDYVLFYTELSVCVDYLISRRNRWGYFILILSNLRIPDVAPLFDLVDGVLIIESDQKPSESSNTSYSHPKITGTYENHGSMLTALKQIVADTEQHIFQHLGNNGIRTFDREGKALRNLETEIGPFLWCHVFKSQ